MKLLLALFICFVLPKNISAQELSNDDNSIIGLEAIKDLSKGTLIVRLSKFELRIEKVKALNGEERAQHEKEKLEKANMMLIDDFRKNYSFSKIEFVFEDDLHAFLSDEKSNVFLDDQLQIDPNIQLVKGPIFILATYRNKVFQLHDRNFNLIEKPAPEYTNKNFGFEYNHSYSKIAKKISELFIKNKSASRFNKKLFLCLEKSNLS